MMILQRGRKRLDADAVADCTALAIHDGHAACHGVLASGTIGGGVFAAPKTAVASE